MNISQIEIGQSFILGGDAVTVTDFEGGKVIVESHNGEEAVSPGKLKPSGSGPRPEWEDPTFYD